MVATKTLYKRKTINKSLCLLLLFISLTIYLCISTQPTQCPQHHPEAAQSKASGSSHRSSGGSGDAPGSSGDEGGHQEQLGAVEQHHQGLGLQLGHQYIDKQRKGTHYNIYFTKLIKKETL